MKRTNIMGEVTAVSFIKIACRRFKTCTSGSTKNLVHFWRNAALIAVSLLSPLIMYSQAWQWVSPSGGTARDEAELSATDAMGNVYVCGKFSDTAWFGNSFLISSGGVDVFIAKYTRNGVFCWARKGGTTLDAEGLSCAADAAGNLAVTGHYKGNITFGSTTLTGNTAVQNFFVALYDSSGSLQWAQKAVGGAIHGKGVQFDKFGNVLVTGHYTDSAVFSPSLILPNTGSQNAFLAKYNAAGVLQWAVYGGGQYVAWASSVGVDSQGNAIITGAFKDTCYFGNHQIITYGVNDVFLAKCSPSGTWLWATHAGGSSDDYGNGIEVDVFDHIAVTGSFFLTVNFPPAPAITSYGGKDGFLAYYTPAGNCLWSHPFGGTSEDKGIGVSTDVAGNVYVTGFIKNSGNFGNIALTSAGGDDICLAKYNRSGAVLWARLDGGTSPDYGKGMQVWKQGLISVAGYFEGSASFSGMPVISKGNRESYAAMYYDGSPVITSQPLAQNLCFGDSLQLLIQLENAAGASFEWFRDTTKLSGFTTNSLKLLCDNIVLSGKYYCLVTNAHGTTVSDTALVYIAPYPVTSLPDTVMMGAADQFTFDAGPGFSSYLWETGDTTQSVSLYGYQVVPYFYSKSNTHGYLSVRVQDTLGCYGYDSVLVVVFFSIEEHNNYSVIVFPNPGSDVVFVRSHLPLVYVELYDFQGRLAGRFYPSETRDSEISIPVTGFPDGVYHLKVFSSQGVFNSKFIKFNH